MTLPLTYALIACALSSTLTAYLCAALSAGVSPLMAAMAAAVPLMLAFMSINGRCVAIGGVLIAGGGYALARFMPDYFARMYAAVVPLFGSASVTQAAAREGIKYAAPYAAALLSLVFFTLACMRTGIFPAMALTGGTLIAGWYAGKNPPGWHVALTLAALVLQYALAMDERGEGGGARGKPMRALPIALITGLLAVMLMPQMGTTYAPLEHFAERIRQNIRDYLMFNDPRVAYSVQSDGLQMLGSRMGGPARPLENAVMRVRTDRPLLLRGSIKQFYTGLDWTQSASNSRILFADPLRRSYRGTVLDANRSSGDAFIQVNIDVEFVARGISTLYLPHRLTDLTTGDGMVPYYNDSGEVFITRSVESGDAYSFVANVQLSGSTALMRLIESRQTISDTRYTGALANYVQLPYQMPDALYGLLSEITRGATTPYAKAVAAEQYLKANYRYTLDPVSPSKQRDFAADFLLNTKEGYCTYFATAMAVLMRMSNIPARYIEGYAVMPDRSGITEVTGKDAHAWAEVYFNGVGWIAFDPTSGNQGAALDATPPEEDQQQPTPTPTLSQTTPTPQTDITHKPEPEDEPLAVETPNEAAPPYGIIALAIALTLCAAVVGMVVYRFITTAPKHIAAKAQANARAYVWYRASLKLLGQWGYAPKSGETPTQFAARVCEAIPQAQAFVRATGCIIASRYGKSPPDAISAQVAFMQLNKAAPLKVKWAFAKSRFARGIGSIDQIP